jgi:hypothetical protein
MRTGSQWQDALLGRCDSLGCVRTYGVFFCEFMQRDRTVAAQPNRGGYSSISRNRPRIFAERSTAHGNTRSVVDTEHSAIEVLGVHIDCLHRQAERIVGHHRHRGDHKTNSAQRTRISIVGRTNGTLPMAYRLTFPMRTAVLQQKQPFACHDSFTLSFSFVFHKDPAKL